MYARSVSAHLGAWQEIIQIFLQLAAREPDKSSVSHLATALGRFFPSCRLIVLSCTKEKPTGPSWNGADWCDEESRLISREDAERCSNLFERLDQKIDTTDYSLCFTTSAELPWVLVLDNSPRSSSSVERKIGIVIQEAGLDLWDVLVDRFGWLRRYLEGMPALATAYIAVSRAQEARLAWELALISDLRSAVADFVHSGAAGAARQLELGQQVEAKFSPDFSPRP